MTSCTSQYCGPFLYDTYASKLSYCDYNIIDPHFPSIILGRSLMTSRFSGGVGNLDFVTTTVILIIQKLFNFVEWVLKVILNCLTLLMKEPFFQCFSTGGTSDSVL